MSIVNLTSDRLPKQGQVIYCNNDPYSSDRAVFDDGKFISGGEFPIKEYAMSNVTKWFDLGEYHEGQKNKSCYMISFEIAELIAGEE